MVCRSCGRRNDSEARFCGTCGEALDARARDSETRKVVTVVFTDVAGSTALGERLDPDERLNEQLGSEYGVRIAARTGVNTGEVIVGQSGADQKLATGDAVNMAARLEQAAETR
jgi:class 3 adenylate cyclase